MSRVLNNFDKIKIGIKVTKSKATTEWISYRLYNKSNKENNCSPAKVIQLLYSLCILPFPNTTYTFYVNMATNGAQGESTDNSHTRNVALITGITGQVNHTNLMKTYSISSAFIGR